MRTNQARIDRIGGQVAHLGARGHVRANTTVRRLLSVDEVAEVLGVPVSTLYQWRYKGVGPIGLRVGRHLRYRAVDVCEWIDRRAAEEARSWRG